MPSSKQMMKKKAVLNFRAVKNNFVIKSNNEQFAASGAAPSNNAINEL